MSLVLVGVADQETQAHMLQAAQTLVMAARTQPLAVLPWQTEAVAAAVLAEPIATAEPVVLEL